MSVSKLDSYQNMAKPLPEKYVAWQVFGAGFDNLGQNGKPQTLELRPPKPNEILLRIDALGLCLSDIKIINQGSDHARLRGRDLANDPTVLGHECAVTVAQVGDRWQEKFKTGDRFIVQADIYFHGLSFAFGYLIPGGMAQYAYLDERGLDGDDGCYLLPVKPETGYSESALAEPWACVEMSYNLHERVMPGDADNLMLIVTDDDPADWLEANPHAVLMKRDLEGLNDDLYDDIVVTAPTPEIVQDLASRLKRDGAMFLFGAPEKDGPASLDIGRIHYENLRFYGGAGNMEALAQIHKRHDLLEGGAALFIGAGGPMGQMHVQRSVEIASGPKVVVVTDLDRARLDHIEARFGQLAASKDIVFKTFAPSQFASQADMDAAVRAVSPGGFNDVCVLAPVSALVEGAMGFAADNALVNVFAGLGIGSMSSIRLSDLCRGIKIIGSSGSRISDLRKVLEMVEARELNTNLSVAAIGGLNAAREGLEGVKAAKFPGKTVIYPHILDLPLMSIEEIPERLPEIMDKLNAQGAWTNEAEKALLERFLK